MTVIGEAEKKIQRRVVQLFIENLHYDYLVSLSERDNHNVREGELEQFLFAYQGYAEREDGDALMRRALLLHDAARHGGQRHRVLRYGTIQAPEKYDPTWKEDGPGDDPLHKALLQLCSPARFLELIHDFVVFDSGARKLCRHNQFIGVRAAQACLRRREGGIIWHTQGSGKSLTMVKYARLNALVRSFVN